MAGLLAIAAYRSLIDGLSTGRLDIQVRWFDERDPSRVRELIASEPAMRYRNDGDEEVCWEFVEVLAVDTFEPTDSGDEVIGFIASTDDLVDLA